LSAESYTCGVDILNRGRLVSYHGCLAIIWTNFVSVSDLFNNFHSSRHCCVYHVLNIYTFQV